MKILSKICQSCGNEFYKPKWCNPKRFNEQYKFCSLDCKDKHQVEYGSWNKGKHYSKEMLKKMNFSGLEKGRGFFKGKKKPEQSGENHPNWKPKEIHLCPTCNKEMLLSPWEKRRKFCSLVCRGFGKRGINSPVYKGNEALAKIRNRITQMAEYTEWRFQCFKRDNFTCQFCKDPNAKPLEIHHIKPYAEIKKQYGFKTPEEARLCKELWDVKNGITLCRTCHRTTDTYAKNLK